MPTTLSQLGDASASLNDADLIIVQQAGTDTKGTVAKIKSAARIENGSALTLESDTSITVKGDILPEMTGASGDVSIRNIGSSSAKINTIYAHDLQLDSSSLYVNGKKIIEDVSSTMTFTTSEDQALEIKTSASTAGTGNGNISLTAGNQVNMTADGDVNFTVSSNSGSTQGLSFSNQSTGGNISFSTPNGAAVFNHAVEIGGDLTVSGSTTTVDTQTVLIEDNMIQVNSSQTGTPLTTMTGGMEVNRGDELNYRFIFAEDTDTFRVGEQGNTQAVATREDSPTDGAVPYWDDTDKMLKTDAFPTGIMKFTSDTSFPTSPSAGDECYRTDLDAFYKYTGTVWVQI